MLIPRFAFLMAVLSLFFAIWGRASGDSDLIPALFIPKENKSGNHLVVRDEYLNRALRDRQAALAGGQMGGRLELVVHPSEGDEPLSNGAHVDRSCLLGKSSKEKRAFLKAIEASIKRVQDRAQACGKYFEFPQPLEVPEILNQTVFLCGIASYGRKATSIYGYQAMIGSRPKMVSASLFAKDYGYMIILNLRTESDLLNGLAEFDSFLFHELLHFTPANNRSWHSELENHGDSNCDTSRFRDFIYLLQAVCYPKSWVGGLFFGDEDKSEIPSAKNCENVCEDALTQVDPAVKEEFSQYLGVPPLFKPYLVTEANLFCDKIRRTGSTWLK